MDSKYVTAWDVYVTCSYEMSHMSKIMELAYAQPQLFGTCPR